MSYKGLWECNISNMLKSSSSDDDFDRTITAHQSTSLPINQPIEMVWKDCSRKNYCIDLLILLAQVHAGDTSESLLKEIQ